MSTADGRGRPGHRVRPQAPGSLVDNAGQKLDRQKSMGFLLDHLPITKACDRPCYCTPVPAVGPLLLPP
ncbi:hypothetical protein AOLI_G00105530 [Acnodon oligacanthus]